MELLLELFAVRITSDVAGLSKLMAFRFQLECFAF